MEITKTLRSFHLKAQLLKKQLGSGRQAWQRCESEYFEIFERNRYNSYESFKVKHCRFIKQLQNK